MDSELPPSQDDATQASQNAPDKRPRLQDQHDLEWLSPNELFERMLDTVRLSDRTSVREELDRFRQGETHDYQILGMTKQTPEDMALYKEKVGKWETERQNVLSVMEERFIRYGAEGAWLAFGQRSIFQDDELILPKFWNFLAFDRSNRRAVSKAQGLEFAGIRCLILQDLPSPWRQRALLELNDLENAVRSGRYGVQLTTSSSRSPIAEQGKKLPLFNRVWLALDAMGDEAKQRLRHRGGKIEIARQIAAQIPEAQPSSIERELRNVLKDKDLT